MYVFLSVLCKSAICVCRYDLNRVFCRNSPFGKSNLPSFRVVELLGDSGRKMYSPWSSRVRDFLEEVVPSQKMASRVGGG